MRTSISPKLHKLCGILFNKRRADDDDHSDWFESLNLYFLTAGACRTSIKRDLWLRTPSSSAILGVWLDGAEASLVAALKNAATRVSQPVFSGTVAFELMQMFCVSFGTVLLVITVNVDEGSQKQPHENRSYTDIRYTIVERSIRNLANKERIIIKTKNSQS